MGSSSRPATPEPNELWTASPTSRPNWPIAWVLTSVARAAPIPVAHEAINAIADTPTITAERSESFLIGWRYSACRKILSSALLPGEIDPTDARVYRE